MKSRVLFLLMLVLPVIAACSDLAGQPEIVATVQLPPTHEPISVEDPSELGAAIFAARCTACHGVTGAGDGEVAANAGAQVPDFTIEGTSASQSLEEWTQVIRVGRLENLMPPWENSLSPEEIDAVAQYTYTLWQNPIEVVEQPDPEPQEVIEVEGRIAGIITQGTEGEPPPEDLFMGLHVLDAEDNQVDFRTLELTNASQYAFEEIALRSDYRYMVTAVYNDIVFSSDRMTINGSAPTLNVPMTVYEITDDPAVMQIDFMTTILLEEDNRLVSQQFISFLNTSDRVFRTNTQVDTFAYESVRIPLPEDAVILNMPNLAQRFSLQETDTGQVLVDSRPVVPGENHSLELIYGVPYNGRLDVSIETNYPIIVEPELLIPPDRYDVSGGSFGFVELQSFDFGAYERYVAFPISAEGSLNMTVRRIGGNTTPISGEVVISLAILSIGMTMIGVGIYSLLRSRKKLTVTDEASTQDSA